MAERIGDLTPRSEALERILTIATALFAERGLNGVTTRELAAAVGLNVATVHYHAGTKQAIYQAVFRRLDELELALVTSFTSGFRERRKHEGDWLRPFLIEVTDTIVTFAAAFPDISRLRLRQYLEPIEGVEDPQQDATRPTWSVLEDAFEEARIEGVLARDVDTRMFAHSYDWLVVGFFSGGAAVGEVRETRTHAEIEAFRAYLQRYTLLMLGV